MARTIQNQQGQQRYLAPEPRTLWADQPWDALSRWSTDHFTAAFAGDGGRTANCNSGWHTHCSGQLYDPSWTGTVNTYVCPCACHAFPAAWVLEASLSNRHAFQAMVNRFNG